MKREFPIDLSDPKWWDEEYKERMQRAANEDDEEALVPPKPSHEAEKIILDWCSWYITPDLRYILREVSDEDDGSHGLEEPLTLKNSPAVLDCCQAVSLLAIGAGLSCVELEYGVLECILNKVFGMPTKSGQNAAADSWQSFVEDKMTHSLLDADNADLYTNAEETFLGKLRTGGITAYGIPSGNNGKYQVIPVEALMYPLHINYIRNSLKIAPVDNSLEENYGFSIANEDLGPIIKGAIEAGNVVEEWREIRIYKSAIESFCPSSPRSFDEPENDENGNKTEEQTSRKPPYRQAQIIPYLKKLDTLPDSITKEFMQRIRADLELPTLDKNTVRSAVARYRLMLNAENR